MRKRVTRLVNGDTDEVVEADSGAWHADRLRAAAARLGVAMPAATPDDPVRDEARAEAALAGAGWSGFHGTPGDDRGLVVLFGRRLADMPTLLAAAGAAGLGTGGPTHLDTLDCGIVQATRGECLAMLAGEFPVDALLGGAAGRNGQVNAVLDAVAAGPAASAVTVFGSVARGKPGPGDLDLHVDVRGLDAGAGDWCRAGLLALAQRHEGLLDPIVTTHRGTFGRNPGSTGWIPARDAPAILEAVTSEGVPLASVGRLAGTPGELAERCGVAPPAAAPRP